MRTILLLIFLPLAHLSAQKSLFDSLQTARSAAVFFAFGKAELSAEADSAIDGFVVFCKKNERFSSVRVTAHTDSVGGFEANQKLSQKRAETVRNALILKGLDASKISISMFGETKPSAENSTETGRQRNRRATLDAFSVQKMTTVEGQILDKGTGLPVSGATVVFRSKELSDSTMTDSTGRYLARLPIGAVVSVEAYRSGYFFDQKMLKTGPNPSRLVMELPSAQAGEVVALRNLYFVGNKWELLPSSAGELSKVLRFMQLNPSTKIEIAGHINQPFKRPDQLEKWEIELAENRAKTVEEFLLKNGVPQERMRSKGYGNSQMKFPKPKTAEEQELNRRVEIRILETGKVISAPRKGGR